MSGRTVSVTTLAVALLFGALAPVAAQEGGRPAPPNTQDQIDAVTARRLYGIETNGAPGARRDIAPMPRAKRWPDLRAISRYDITGLGVRLEAVPEPPVPPMTPPVPPPCDYRVSVGQGVRVTVPALGPVALDGGFPVAQPTDHRQVFNFVIGLHGSGPRECPVPAPSPACPHGLNGGFGSYCAPALPRLQAPQAQFVTGPGVIRLVAAEDVLMSQPTCPPCPLPKIAPNPLIGTWYRELPALGTVIAATFTHDELKLCMTQSVDGHAVTAVVTAHYALTPDGLVFGAVTGGDVDVKSAPKTGESPFGMELAELSPTVQALVDAPFSFRTKATSAGLMVSGVKFGDPLRHAETGTLGGLFKSARDGKVPAPAPLKTAANKVDAPVCNAPVPARNFGFGFSNEYSAMPQGYVIERVGVDFNTNPPTMNLPAPPLVCPPQPVGDASFGPPFLTKIPGLNPYSPQAVAPPAVRPVQPGVSEDGTKQLAQDAFGQLLQQSGVIRPASGVGGMTPPTGKYMEHFPQYFPPDPVLLVGATVPAAPAPLAKAIPSGTWYRDVAGKQCVVKVAPDHITFTVHDAQEVDGKVSVASLVITADYHMTRDGMTAVGLITNVDVSFEGEFPPEDTKPFFEMLTGLQKELEDKPIALTFRVHGETLVLGNVRMPTGANYMDVQPSVYVAGRYKAAGDKLPKPKPTKMPPEPKLNAGPLLGGPALGAPIGGPVPGLPGSAYPERAPLLPPPPLPGTNSDLIPPQQVLPAPQKVVPSGAWAPPMTEPTKPVPQMPQPTPPPGYRSEDVRQLNSEWRRLWFNDRPAHLTPERIHGGIY